MYKIEKSRSKYGPRKIHIGDQVHKESIKALPSLNIPKRQEDVRVINLENKVKSLLTLFLANDG